jgi:phosphopantothenoylcysteine decarboxylase/phosphopantothenate--cysteine ligase
MTAHAKELMGPATFWSITSNPVIEDLFEKPAAYEITHVSLPETSDVFLIAPATANIIGKLANGIADDMLSTMALSATCPMVIAPAMNCNMYLNPVVVSNVEKLRQLGRIIVEPDSGRLACGDTGIGRLAEPDGIITVLEDVLAEKRLDYSGIRVLVSAGPTQEAIDPVRYISNRSSGKMGYALAAVAAKRGAQVTLVSGPSEQPVPVGVELVDVTTCDEMFQAVTARAAVADLFISAAAPADFAPAEILQQKIKKTQRLTLELEKTRDILAAVGQNKGRTILVGFAAETQNLIDNAQSKLISKNLDVIVGNDVSEGNDVFGSDTNQVVLISRDGETIRLPRISKTEVADRILDYIKQHFMEE